METGVYCVVCLGMCVCGLDNELLRSLVCGL